RNFGTMYSRFLSLRNINIFLGIVLIISGVFKLYDSAIALQGHDVATFLMFALGAAELLAGLWLLMGLYAEQTRPWLVATFAGFSAASFYQAVTGQCSCGCFGSLVVSPWHVLVFDLAVVAVLVRWQPSLDWNGQFSDNPVRSLGLALTALVIGIVAGG